MLENSQWLGEPEEFLLKLVEHRQVPGDDSNECRQIICFPEIVDIRLARSNRSAENRFGVETLIQYCDGRRQAVVVSQYGDTFSIPQDDLAALNLCDEFNEERPSPPHGERGRSISNLLFVSRYAVHAFSFSYGI